MPSQFELFQGRTVPSDLSDPEKVLAYLGETYQLNEDQRNKVDGYIQKKGIEYVREKITLAELEPRENIARYFMAAVRDDFKMPIRSVPKPKKTTKPAASSIPEEAPSSPQELREVAEKLRQFRRAKVVVNAN
jgi:hypothetical protein